MLFRSSIVFVALTVVFAQGDGTRALPAAQTNQGFVRDRDVPARLPVDGIAPIWSGRSLLGVEVNDRKEVLLYSVDHNGNREEVWFGMPDVGIIHVRAFAGGQEGSIVVTGTAYGSDAFTTFLAWIPPDRKQQVVTRVWPYIPDAIAVAPDGTIWCIGRARNEANSSRELNNILRSYDRSGRLLGSWFAKPKKLGRMQQVNTDGSHLAASSDRVGWLTSAGEYIEYSPQGVELDRFDGLPGVENEGLRITGLALSPKNALVVGLHGGQPQKNLSQVWALDRRAGTWQPALPETTDWASVAGFDGERLVVLPSLGEAGNMRWYSSKRAEVGQ